MGIELQILLLILNSLLGAIITHVFFVCILGERLGFKSIYYVVLFLFFVTNVMFSFLFEGTALVPVFFAMFCFVYSLTLFAGNLIQRFFAAGVFIAYGSITETLSVFLISWITNNEFLTVTAMDNLYFFVALTAKLLLFVVVLCVTRFRRTEVLKAPVKRLVPLFIVILICTFLSIANGLLVIGKANVVTFLELLTEIAIFTISILVFYIYKSLVALTEKEIHNELLEKQLTQDSHHFQRMDDYLSEVRSLKHDFVHHLMSIKAMVADKNYVELEKYTDRYSESVQKILSEVVTGLPSVDAVISMKKEVATKSAIVFGVHSNNISEIDINPVHLNIILANTLDNAITACLECADDISKKIKLSLMMEGEYLYLEVVNSSRPIYFEDGTIPQTTKADKVHHGLGLESTQRLVLMYEGMLHCEYKDGKFSFRSRLKNIDFNNLGK